MIEPPDLEVLTAFIVTVRKEASTSRVIPSPGELLLRAGRFFQGAPYAARTLEVPGPEALVINLRTFDCFTLVENCCALALLARQIIAGIRAGNRHRPVAANKAISKEEGSGRKGFIPSPRQGRPDVPAASAAKDQLGEDALLPPPDLSPERLAVSFAALLRTLRYRDGVIAGFASRLHYFSDWLGENERKGLIRNVTARLGGRPAPKVMDFMTQHRELYPPLGNADIRREIWEIERRLSASPRPVLTKEEIALWEGKITPGDLVAIATHEEGLDVTHAGLAIRRGGRLHLLHASSQAGRVIISPETLAAYLEAQDNRAGIIVARLR
ncbi:MAG: DUF1460 domain-containing protein [Syntrophobacterales bacterium]|nr:DUF1460 domain-containing protein [Syntrophobacterales bacterium]